MSAGRLQWAHTGCTSRSKAAALGSRGAEYQTALSIAYGNWCGRAAALADFRRVILGPAPANR